MEVVPIPAFSDNYIWAIVDKKQALFDCVDPGEALLVINFAAAQGLTLRAILLTHHHHDHIGGVAQLTQAFECMLYGPEDTRIPLLNHQVQQNQTIQLGLHKFSVLFNPGHTASHISYYEAEQGWLFCGDTLFSAGCGRVFDGTMEELYQSLLLFKHLPSTTKVFCAHEYTLNNLRFARMVEPSNRKITDLIAKLENNTGCSLPSTLALECAINPFLRLDEKEVIEYAQEHGASSAAPFEVFKILRAVKDKF